MSDIIQKVGYMDIEVSKLHLAPYNPKKFSSQKFNQLKESVKIFGLVDPLVVNEVNYRVIGGNQRLKVAIDLGMKTVPCSVVHIEDEKVEMTLNKALIDIELPVDEDRMEDIIDRIQKEDVYKQIYGEANEMIDSMLEEAENPEYEFSPDFHRKLDYMVIVFDNAVEWTNFISQFDVKKAYDTKKDGIVGIGRVLTFEKFQDGLRKLKLEEIKKNE